MEEKNEKNKGRRKRKKMGREKKEEKKERKKVRKEVEKDGGYSIGMMIETAVGMGWDNGASCFIERLRHLCPTGFKTLSLVYLRLSLINFDFKNKITNFLFSNICSYDG